MIMSNISFYVAAMLHILFISAHLSIPVTAFSLQSQHIKTHLPVVSQSDQDIIKQQLGYIPPNLHSVSARSKENSNPIAIQTYPLGGGSPQRRAKAAQNLTPFPTLFWLTCPLVSKAISNLEREGAAKLLEARLHDTENAFEEMMACHEEYAKLRWNSLVSEDRNLLLSGISFNDDKGNNQDSISFDEAKRKKQFEGFCNILQKSGVAGTDYNRKDGSLPSVKCLHAHYAHYRSVCDENHSQNTNIIGKWTHELLCQEDYDFL